MKVFLPGGNQRTQTVYVQPGKEFPNSNFCDKEGSATLIAVVFKNGKASVEDALGKYMIDKGYAQASPLILPTQAMVAA